MLERDHFGPTRRSSCARRSGPRVVHIRLWCQVAASGTRFTFELVAARCAQLGPTLLIGLTRTAAPVNTQIWTTDIELAVPWTFGRARCGFASATVYADGGPAHATITKSVLTGSVITACLLRGDCSLRRFRRVWLASAFATAEGDQR